MLQTLTHQKKIISVAVLGNNNLPPDIPVITFRELLKLSKQKTNKAIVFHARRNDEMIQALIAKHIFGANLKIAFTSTAQRDHSKFTRWLMHRMDTIISTNQAAAAYLTERPADIIIPHGIDAQRYHPPSSKNDAWKKLNLPGKLGIGVFGRIRASKGTDLFIDTMIPLLKKHTMATAIICGECLPKDLAFKDLLIKKIAEAQLDERFVFLGKRPFDELPELFQGMSIVAALSRNEGFGLTPLEAMASGCAVVTSQAGAWPEIIDEDISGYCIQTGNAQAATEKIDMLLSNPIKLTEMGKAARQQVLAKHTIEQEAKTLTEFLLSLA